MLEFTNEFFVEYELIKDSSITTFKCYDWKLNYSGEIIICYVLDFESNLQRLYFDLSCYNKLVIKRSDNIIVFSHYGGKYL